MTAQELQTNLDTALPPLLLAEFIAKIGDCLEELDETAYWLELLAESGIVPAAKLSALRDECLNSSRFSRPSPRRRNPPLHNSSFNPHPSPDGRRLTGQGVLELDRTAYGSTYGSGTTRAARLL